jgi:hypothetical protein
MKMSFLKCFNAKTRGKNDSTNCQVSLKRYSFCQQTTTDYLGNRPLLGLVTLGICGSGFFFFFESGKLSL